MRAAVRLSCAGNHVMPARSLVSGRGGPLTGRCRRPVRFPLWDSFGECRTQARHCPDTGPVLVVGRVAVCPRVRCLLVTCRNDLEGRTVMSETEFASNELAMTEPVELDTTEAALAAEPEAAEPEGVPFSELEVPRA